MRRFRNAFQHLFNPLHVFCKLRGMGFNKSCARVLSRAYEVAVYRFICF